MRKRGFTLTVLGPLLVAFPSFAQQYIISTFAGGAPPPSPAVAVKTAIGNPYGIATDASGNVYFTGLNCVFKLDQNGILTRIAGTSRSGYSGDGGLAVDAELEASDLALDSAGNIYLSCRSVSLSEARRRRCNTPAAHPAWWRA